MVQNTVDQKPLTIALIGNPNTGKSTLFNALTGGQARIGNFPGVTVEQKVGSFTHDDQTVSLIDLPGTYSLSPRSADEMVSVDVLLGKQKDVATPDAVVCIVDVSNLERNLYLFSQVKDIGLPVVLVLNMCDLAATRGVTFDVDQLAERLNVKIVQTEAHQRKGITELRDAMLLATQQEHTPAPKLFPEEFYAECQQLSNWLDQAGQKDVPFYSLERMILDVHGQTEERSQTPGLTEYLQEARLRLASNGIKVPACETKVRYGWIRTQLDGILTRRETQELTFSDRFDKITTHKVWGLMIFVLLMFLVFQGIFTWAEPFMNLVADGQGWISDAVSASMPPGTFRSLLVDGIIAGVGGVIIFLPQIILLFTFIAIMEDCGYMARAAFLMDKLMTRIGLSGKSFLPLMSSFACAIPGVMATRVIENKRDRMLTMLIAPLMSCSARLPVYLLMIAAFIPATSYLGGWIDLQGMLLFAMYSLGVIVAIPVAWLMKKFFFPGETPPFVMELPQYKWPSPRIVFSRVYDRSKAFVVRAGSLIFCVTVVVWALGYFPEDHTQQHQITTQIEELESILPEDAVPTQQLEDLYQQQREVSAELIRESYLGQMGIAIEPAVKPLGWDWRIGIGAIASFPAREVIISTMGTIFSLGGDVEADDPGLQQTLQSATWPNGAPLFTIPVALSVMVFFALCAQCGATLMVIRRETNSWRWPIFTFTYMTVLAYVAAFIVYQAGTALGF